MEYHVAQIKDTRERISLKHIKSLDIVKQEVERIMPSDLSQAARQMDDAEADQAIRKDF